MNSTHIFEFGRYLFIFKCELSTLISKCITTYPFNDSPVGSIDFNKQNKIAFNCFDYFRPIVNTHTDNECFRTKYGYYFTNYAGVKLPNRRLNKFIFCSSNFNTNTAKIHLITERSSGDDLLLIKTSHISEAMGQYTEIFFRILNEYSNQKNEDKVLVTFSASSSGILKITSNKISELHINIITKDNLFTISNV